MQSQKVTMRNSQICDDRTFLLSIAQQCLFISIYRHSTDCRLPVGMQYYLAIPKHKGQQSMSDLISVASWNRTGED